MEMQQFLYYDTLTIDSLYKMHIKEDISTYLYQ